MSNVNWDYIAGFFDGEGNLHWRENGRKQSATFTQKDRQVLEEIRKFLLTENIRSNIYFMPSDNIFRLRISQSTSPDKFLSSLKTRIIVKKKALDDISEKLVIRKKARLSLDEIEEIQRMRNRGFSISQISEQLHRDWRSIRKYITLIHFERKRCFKCGLEWIPYRQNPKFCPRCRGCLSLPDEEI